MYTTERKELLNNNSVRAEAYVENLSAEQQVRYALFGAAAIVLFTTVMLTAFTVGCGKF